MTGFAFTFETYNHSPRAATTGTTPSAQPSHTGWHGRFDVLLLAIEFLALARVVLASAVLDGVTFGVVVSG